VVKISWYGDVHFEHAVNGFLVAEKESVKNIQKQLENVPSTLYIKAMCFIGLHDLHVLRKAKKSLVTHITLASQQHQSLWCHFEVLINSLRTTKELQPECLHLRPLYARGV